MANEITRRLPSSQARLTDTYVPSNLPEPLAPQALPQIQQPYLGSNNVGNALQNLINPLLNFGNEVIEADRIEVASQEQLRVSKMAIEEVRAELMGQARDAEGAGLLAPGANPYRKVVAQEYLAERVMRDQFEKAISAETARFSNPLSNEDPAPFAREKFGEFTHGMGYFAQRRAVDLYDSMTKNWLSQVQNTKSARLVSLNEEQLRDNAYNAFRTYQEEVDDPNITADQAYENLITTVEYWDQKYMQAVGPGGREHSVSALASYVSTAVKQATDEADLAELTDLITKIEEETEGPLAFNMEQRAEVDAIRTLIHNKSESLGNVTNQDHDEAVDSLKNQYFLIRDQNPSLSEAEVEEELRTWGKDNNVPDTAIAEAVLSGIPTIREQEYLRTTRADDREENEAIKKAVQLAETDGPQAGIDSLDPNMSAEGYRSAVSTIVGLHTAKTRLDDEWQDWAKIELSTADALSKQVGGVTNIITNDLSVGNELARIMYRDIEEAGRKAAKVDGATEDSVQQAVADRVATWSEFTLLDITGQSIDFDLENIPQGIPKDAIQLMTNVRQQRAAEGVTPKSAPGQPLPPPALDAEDAPMNIEAIRESYDAGNFDAARPQGAKDRKERLSHIKAISGGEPYGTWNIVTGTKAEIKEDGVYISRYPKSRFVPAILLKRDSSQTDRYVLDKRLSGLTVQELSSGMTAEGMRLDVSPDFLNPSKTVMLDPEKFDTHLQELIDANKDKLSSDAIIRGTAFGEVYSAYVEAVGVGNEMSFEDFITTQMATVMRAVHPVTPQQIKALEDSSQ